MAIAYFQFGDIGGKLPLEGPLSAIPTGQFLTKPGTVIEGDQGAEFVFCTFNAVSGMTVNQGDVFCWNHNYIADRAGAIQVTGAYDVGVQVGTLFLGGRTGDSTSYSGSYGTWQQILKVGTYGIWCQRCGSSLANINAYTSPLLPTTMGDTAVAGRMTFLAAGTHSNSIAPGTIAMMPKAPGTAHTFTADTLTGSPTLLNLNDGSWLKVGMRVTGTGIPTTTTSPATVITAIDGATVTLSAAATATNAAQTITVLIGSTSGNVLSGSPIISNVISIEGFYPNQTIAGTNIPASTTILTITGSNGNYSILMSANATGTLVNCSLTVTTAPNYNEVLLSWPYFTTSTP